MPIRITLVLLVLGGALAKGAGGPQSPTKAKQQRCSNYVSWAMRSGIREHPERYPGLTTNSTWAQVQQYLHQTVPASRCPGTTAALPSFAASLGLNATQLAAYKSMRKRHAAELGSKQFRQKSGPEKAKTRHRLGIETVRELKAMLNSTQIAIFRNRTASPRRPPAMHVAASMWSSFSSAAKAISRLAAPTLVSVSGQQ